MTTQEFKQLHKRFADALKYIVENEEKLKADPARWQKIKANFAEKFEKPLDSAWLALNREERKQFSSVYLYRKAQVDPIVQKILKTFNGKIVSVTEGE